jgi:hypothetical protein
MPMVQSGMHGNLFNNQNPHPFRTPRRAKLNALGIQGDTGKGLLFPPQRASQGRGPPRYFRNGKRDGFRQNETRALEYSQNNTNMNKRQGS